MRSPVDERGRSCRKTSRSANVGTSFSIPTTLTSTGGSVVHMRPFPSDSTTTTVPVSATAKFAPLTPTLALRNFSRRYTRATSASSAGSSDERRLGDRPQKEIADLRAVAMDRRHEDVRRPVAVELQDQLGEVGLDRVNATRRERVVQLDLIRGERLHLHDFGSAV